MIAPTKQAVPSVYQVNREPSGVVCWEWWTPERAALEVANMHPDQRNRRAHKIKQYREAMNRREWTESFDAIVRDGDGMIVNGQHRIIALSEAEIPGLWLLMAQTNDRRAMSNMDRGMLRGERDALRMGGYGKHEYSEIATLKMLVEGMNQTSRSWSIATVATAMAKYGETVRLVSEAADDRGVTRGVRGAICRAMLAEDQNRVLEFCRVLSTGMPVSKNASDDFAAITMRNLLVRTVGASGGAIERDRYCKTETAIRGFLRREQMTRVYGTTKELWPIEEDAA